MILMMSPYDLLAVRQYFIVQIQKSAGKMKNSRDFFSPAQLWLWIVRQMRTTWICYSSYCCNFFSRVSLKQATDEITTLYVMNIKGRKLRMAQITFCVNNIIQRYVYYYNDDKSLKRNISFMAKTHIFFMNTQCRILFSSHRIKLSSSHFLFDISCKAIIRLMKMAHRQENMLIHHNSIIHISTCICACFLLLTHSCVYVIFLSLPFSPPVSLCYRFFFMLWKAPQFYMWISFSLLVYAHTYVYTHKHIIVPKYTYRVSEEVGRRKEFFLCISGELREFTDRFSKNGWE